MSEQEKKWREEFEEVVGESNQTSLSWLGFLAAKRQCAERIAELEAQLAATNKRAEYLLIQCNVANNSATELRAKLDAWEKQEPVGRFKFSNGVNFQVTYDGADSFPLYAKPVPATPAIPEGWQLVPKEPTAEMLTELYGLESVWVTAKGQRCTHNYLHMLAAAPKPPTNKGEA